MPDSVSAPPRPVTPLSILAAELDAVCGELDGVPGIDPAVLARLLRARDLAGGLDPYIGENTTPESPALAELARRTSDNDWDSGPLEQEMLSGHVEGQVLKFLVHLARARRVLEIGMFTGYSALAMAEALPDDGDVVACEIDAGVAEFAQRCFDESPAGGKIAVVVAPALETLARLSPEDGTFDLVFIDADKPGYGDYLDALLDSSLLSPHAVIAVDNTLMQGEPYTGADRSVNGEAITSFNRSVALDPRVEQVILPLRDGLTLIRRIPS